MLQRPTFRSTGLPLGLAVIALIVLNLGLYTRLVALPEQVVFEIPYFEDFATLTTNPYDEFGGDWEIRDETLVQLSTDGFDLTTYIPLALAPEQIYVYETKIKFLGGTMGGGVLFNAQQTTSRQKSHMVRFNVDQDQLWMIYGYFGDDSDFIGQGSILLAITPENVDQHRLKVQVNPESYNIYLDDGLLVDNIPLNYFGGSVGLITATSQVAFDDVRIDENITQAIPATQPPIIMTDSVLQPTTDVSIILDTPLFTDSFDSVGGESLWQPISGDWLFSDGRLVQQLTDGFDLSNIYQRALPYPMTFKATFQHQQGSGAGVLFNLPQTGSKNGGHMVRYIDMGDVIAWGYFDESGVFNGQGDIKVGQPGQISHTLAIIVNGQTYDIYLDDTLLRNGIPIVNPVSPSYIGVTASQSAVSFENVDVFTGTTNLTQPDIETTANINIESATGTWIIDGGNITQTDTDNTDYVAGTGFAGEQFTISVDINLPPDVPDAGAGLIFHMNGRDDRSQGYMVRFGSGGSEVFWGQFTDDGTFAGDGGVPTEIEPQESQRLQLIVSENTFDIRINNKTLVESIPLQRTNGWIGLVSFRGPVQFSNLNLQLGE